MVRNRGFKTETDYNRIRRLLIECYRLNGNQHSWAVDRLDWWRYNLHARDEMSGVLTWMPHVRLWETDEGELVGVAHPEDGLWPGLDYNDVHLEIHPAYRHLEGEMLAWAEADHLARRPEGLQEWPLCAFTYEGDHLRETLLRESGFERAEQDGYKRSCDLGNPVSPPQLPPGYSIRTVERTEMAEWAEVVGSAFENPENSPERCRVWLTTPTKHIDIVVVSPEGAFAAYCLLWLDEDNRIAMFEPVGTHAEHRRKGLAKAMLLDGLQRLRELNYERAYLGVGMDPAANGLYESVGFTEAVPSYLWKKIF